MFQLKKIVGYGHKWWGVNKNILNDRNLEPRWYDYTLNSGVYMLWMIQTAPSLNHSRQDFEKFRFLYSYIYIYYFKNIFVFTKKNHTCIYVSFYTYVLGSHIRWKNLMHDAEQTCMESREDYFSKNHLPLNIWKVKKLVRQHVEGTCFPWPSRPCFLQSNHYSMWIITQNALC